MNIPYLLTVAARGGAAGEGRSAGHPSRSYGDYDIFRIAGATGYVQVMQNQPVRLNVAQAAWRD